ncbi:GNAT family N-acetyltransferase [Planococcus shenhongbingii]|uniref:GNAT family N-acetyltransferase n=1 Tax=Planococcus shenhongbingii TaxID=3058398 RepID=UPI00260346B3|nr:GNAT family N-acetyltransferase [Planococcus sp. N016]WKA58475.1 GNAT family N-acetyltransferase [Planococcus sp. N016]
MSQTEKIYANLPVLETKRLILRKLTIEDAQDMFAYASEPIVSRFMPWEVHNSVEDTKGFIRGVLQGYEQKNKLTWAIELKSEDKMIGTIDFVKWLPKYARAEIAYALSHLYWGNGFTQEAAKALIAFGFEKMQLNKVEAPIVPDNFQSQRVLEKVGMVCEGVARQHFVIKGEFVDLAMYAVLKEEFARA